MPDRFPFPRGFVFRQDEAAALEGIFERAFFHAEYSEEALEALRTLRYLPREEGGGSGPGERARSRDPSSVILCRGADGMGKTRIFQHLRERASDREVSVYELDHYEVEGIPLKPFLHTIRRILRDHDLGSALRDKYRYALSELLPDTFETADVAGESEDAPLRVDHLLPEDKARIFDGITQLLIDVARRRPLLILVHDLHWADLATVELLHYIGRNLHLRRRLDTLARSGGGRRGAGTAERFGYRDVTDRDEATRVGKYVNVARRTPPSSSGRGPEIDGFDTDEWRVLAPRSTVPLAFEAWAGDDGSWINPGGDDRSGDADGTDAPRVPRLLILGNYRSCARTDPHVEEALDDLGGRSFACHFELRPLERDEADHFIQRSIEGVSISGRQLEVTPDAIDALHELTEGFPSFQQELFRGLYLDYPHLASWDAALVRDWVGASPDAADGSATEDPDAADGSPDSGGADETEAAADGAGSGEPEPKPRQAVLARRLRGIDRGKEALLYVLALVRRPATAAFLERVLGRLAAPEGTEPSRCAADLSCLVERGLVERDPDPEGAAGDVYRFRLWDYVEVVSRTIAEDELRRIHDAIARECEERTGVSGEEGYEVYYHLRRGTEPSSAVDFGVAAAERFVRSFSLERARQLYRELVEILEGDEARPQRLDVLERIARISAALREHSATEDACRAVAEDDRGTLTPESRLDLLILETEAVGALDPARALKIIGKGQKLLSEEVSPAGVRLYQAIARARLERQDWKRAINFGLRGLAICQKLDGLFAERAACHRLVAQAFYRKGDYSHALDNYQRGLEAAEKANDRRLMVSILDDLGRVYLERGEYFRSARYLYKALEVRHRDHDIVGLSRSYDQLALCYRRNGDYLKTIENLNRSLHLKERIGDWEALNPTLGNLGDLYFRLGHYVKAIAYFRREVETCRSLRSKDQDETLWLVDAFIRLGRVYFEIGDIRQAESYCKQVLTLASEFKLRSQEADGRLLEGGLFALERDWNAAEKSLRAASEAYGRQGHRRRETAATLDLAEVRFSREQHDEALKLASKAQVVAEEIKALDLQARALTLKGNVHRFLKGGNAEKVREHLGKALELSQNLCDVSVLFRLYYSLAKVHHSERDFTEAANYYGKAESILKRIFDRLPEDMAVRFHDDRRRKVFDEDLTRFRREAHDRSSLVDTRDRPLTPLEVRDRPVGMADYKDILTRVQRTHRAMHQLHFFDQILGECVEITSADRGFLLRVQNREYLPVTFQGFGSQPTRHPEFSAASQLTEEAIRRGRTVVYSGGDKTNLGRFVQVEALAGRVLLVVPLMTEERIFGGVYIDKPSALGGFSHRDQTLLEAYAEHAGCALQNRRQLDVAIREPLTGFYTPSYFIDRLREAFRWFNLHGRPFSLLGYYLPTLESALGEGREGLGEKLAKTIGEVVSYRSAVCWGNPVLHVLLEEVDLSSGADEILDRLRAGLERLLGEEIPAVAVPAERHYQQGSEIYYALRRRLLPEETDQRSLAELRRVLARDVTIKEAKGILEKHIIERTLRRTRGNITHAARELGIHRPQLSNLLKKHELKREVFERGDPSAVPSTDNGSDRAGTDRN